MDFYAEAEELLPHLIKFRRTVHACPEIEFELPNTKKLISEELTKAGILWEEFAGSIIAKINGNGKKILLMRAEMDALPMREENNLPFRSTVERAHCCGHDVNASNLLGALLLIKKHEAELKGSIVAVFQANEEGGCGAKRLLDEGFLEKYRPDSAIAMHVNAKMPLGNLSYGKGKMFASDTSFDVVIKGNGSHGARPFEGKDPVNIAVQLYNILNSIVAREVNVFDHAIFSIVSIKTGDSYNIIPETVTMQCSLRTYDEKTRLFLKKRFQEAICGMAQVFAIKIDMLIKKEVPSLSTTPDFIDFLIKTAQQILPSEKISKEPDVKYGSEDFAFITEHLKEKAYMSMGAGTDEEHGYLYGQHNSKVIYNESVIRYGAALEALWAFEYFER